MSTRPYGPNTDAVRRLLQRLAALPPEGWVRVSRLYAALQRSQSFAAADRSLGELIAAAGREGDRDAVVGPVVQLAADAASRVAGEATGTRRPGDGEVDSHVDAGDDSRVDAYAEPALAAALALVARDLLAEEHFATLYGPVSWAVPLDELR